MPKQLQIFGNEKGAAVIEKPDGLHTVLPVHPIHGLANDFYPAFWDFRRCAKPERGGVGSMPKPAPNICCWTTAHTTVPMGRSSL